MEPLEAERVSTRLRVLIVDDDEALRTLLGLQLSDYPLLEVVGAASNASEARALCEQVQPDAVVLDILMSDTRGTELIRALHEAHPQMRLIAYSGSASPSVRDELTALGVVLILKGDREALVRELLGSAS
jgi:two-component system, chemotaxis family, protein-glutamate methylesterase/glutaminase